MKKLVIVVALMLFVFGCAATGGLPATPSTPDMPAKPAMPDTPKAPAVPDAPKAPAAPTPPATPKIPGTPASKSSMSLDSTSVSNNPNSNATSESRENAYPGVSIKNVAVQQRLGTILHDSSAGEIDSMVESHKEQAQGTASSGQQGVQRQTVSDPVAAETNNKVMLKTQSVYDPKDDALPAYNTPATSGNSATAQKADDYGLGYPGVKNTVQLEKLNEISAKMEISATPRDDSAGSVKSGSSKSTGYRVIPNPVQSDSKKKVQAKTTGIGFWY